MPLVCVKCDGFDVANRVAVDLASDIAKRQIAPAPRLLEVLDMIGVD